MFLDCFSTPWESTEFLTIDLSNLSNETTLENCPNIITTSSNKQQGGFVKCQQRMLSQLVATPGGFGSTCRGDRMRDPSLCHCTPRVGKHQSHSYTGCATAAA